MTDPLDTLADAVARAQAVLGAPPAPAFKFPWGASRAASRADRAAPARVADILEERRMRYAPTHAVVTTAALSPRLRRLLLLTIDGRARDGVPVWAMAGITGIPESAVVAGLRALQARRLVTLRPGYDLADLDAPPTDAGRRVAALIRSWRPSHG